MIAEHRLFLAALDCLLTGGPLHAAVTTITRSNEALAVVQAEPIDVVVCDVRAVPIPGTELAATLHWLRPNLPVILLADSEDTPMLLNAMLSSVCGFFRKDTPAEEFMEGIDAVLGGQPTVGQSVRDYVWTGFSALQREILQLLARRQAAAAIAAQLGLSKDEARHGLASVYRRLGVQSRPQAIRWLTKAGLTASPASGTIAQRRGRVPISL